jgi:hypothetical protein
VIGRRAFLTTVAAGVAAAPRVGDAQKAGKVWRVGYLFESTPPDPTSAPLKAFEDALREMGYVEGGTSWSSAATPRSSMTGCPISPLSW